MVALVASLLLALSAPALAGPAISCHCFRDREFDATRPAAADPYVLATAQNSLLAAAFDLDKKEVVRAKMTGTPNEDLWVAHAVARRTGLRAADLLDARAHAGSWREALAGMGVDPARLAGELAAGVSAEREDAALAAAVVDDVVAERLGVSRDRLAAVRAAGATDPECVAAAVLARVDGGRDPVELLRRVRSGDATWGSLFHAAGVAPAAIGDHVRRLLR